MARSVKVYVDPSVRMSAFSGALEAAGLSLLSDPKGGSLRVVPSGQRAVAPCVLDGCVSPAGVLDPDSGDVLCAAHALERLVAAARGRVDSHLISQ